MKNNEKKKTSLRKNIIREISRTKSRFISIFAIIGISVGFFTGVKSACPSMIETARQYFDDQNLMDISLLSTVGFDDDDIEAIQKLDFVEQVMPSYSADLIVRENDVDVVAKVMALPDEKESINMPLLKEGRLPNKDGECLIESYIVRLTGKKIGDVIRFNPTVEGKNTTDFIKNLEYKIVGIADSPIYLTYSRGNTNIGSGSIGFYMLIRPEEFISERYTKVFVTTKASKSGISTFSDEYKNIIADEKDVFKKLSENCISRFNNTTLADAKKELADAQAEYADKKDEALTKIADGEKELYQAEKEFAEKIADGEQKLIDGEKQLDDAKQQLTEGQETYQAQIEEAKQKLTDARTQYSEGKTQYSQAQLEYDTKIAQAQRQLDTAQAEFDRQYTLFYSVTKPQAESQLNTLKTSIDLGEKAIANIMEMILRSDNSRLKELNKRLEDYNRELENYRQQYNEGVAQLEDGERQLNAAKEQLETAQTEFETRKAQGAEQLNNAKIQLDEAENQIAAGELEYTTAMNTGLLELQAAQAKITAGEKELSDGKAELALQKETAQAQLKLAREQLIKGKYEAHTQLSEAEEKLSDVQSQLDMLDEAKWYIYDREDNPGYSGLTEDAERVDNIAKVFPLFFLIVAALVCLTTMSRMVEERRTEIGTLKALGYSNADISAKYLIYAGTAGLGGCLVGGALGVLTLPKIIVDTYGIMYMLPETKLVVSWSSYIISSVVAVICICLVAIFSCRRDLKIEPATLMRPKSPKPGKRILLEYMTPIWSKMNFTSKVTARNLFRYKARFLMTVIGVAGCTALIVAGFGLRDSITVIADLQYVQITRYEQLYALSEAETADKKAYLMAKFHGDDRLEDTLLGYMGWSSTTSDNRNEKLNARIIIGENNNDFQKMFVLRDRKTHEHISLSDNGIVIDERMSDVLKVKKGDMIHIHIDDELYTCQISDITENYAGNFIYMTPQCYENITGKTAKYNVVFTTVAESAKDIQHDMANDFMKEDDIITVSLISEQVEAILDTLNSLNIVVFVMIFCAGLLAVVVLYNLTNINIAERVREIATIKVLGFYSLETANYIYRENIILTFVGASVGLLMGSMLSGFIVQSIQMNNVMFPNRVTPLSYFLGFALTFAFSMLVNFIMYFKMNKISMVESLKSIE